MQTSIGPAVPAQPLDDRRIDLWYVRSDATADPGIVDEYRRLLTPEELAQEQRFKFERDRIQHVVARALARIALGQYTETDPGAMEFVSNAFGKPFLSEPAAPLEFNLSHTPGLVVCLVALGREVGVDTEDVSRQVEHMVLGRRFFARGEFAALEAMPAERQGAGFFRFWTLKEAYVKACGLGLSIPLGDFGFALGEGQPPRISFAARVGDDPEHWQFAELRIADRYQVAVAVRGASTEPLAVAVREVRSPQDTGTSRLLPPAADHRWEL